MPLSAWAAVVAEALVQGGVRRVVLSPGARSMPFALRAGDDPRLEVIDVINEGSAAFIALGMARGGGGPVALICTSGSAAAHYFPAVIEASQARLPLLLLTADRPPELQYAEAPQTICQQDLYGRHARAFFDLGPPVADQAWRQKSAQSLARAIHRCQHPDPGPVQVNLPGRKPLEPPAQPPAPDARVPRRLVGQPGLPEGAVALLVDALRQARRPLIVAGPRPPEPPPAQRQALAALARLGLPIYAEASSQLRFAGAPPAGGAPGPHAPPTAAAASTAPGGDAPGHHGPQAASTAPGGAAPGRSAEAARGARQEAPDGQGLAPAGGASAALGDAIPELLQAGLVQAPDLVIQLGLPPVSGAWQRFSAAHPLLRVFVVHRFGWPDPEGGAEAVIAAPAGALLAALAEAAPQLQVDPAWLRSLAAARGAYWAAVDGALTAQAGLSEGEVVRATWAALPADGALMVGNGLAVRHLDRYLAADRHPARPVFTQRGANGIDGLVAGAVGLKLARPGPLSLILGDVSLAHDLSGLAEAARAPGLTIVVLDNGGGRIFELLPVYSRLGAEASFQHLLTPPPHRLRALAAACSLWTAEVDTPAALAAALAEAQAGAGGLILARCPPHGVVELEGQWRAALRPAG